MALCSSTQYRGFQSVVGWIWGCGTADTEGWLWDLSILRFWYLWWVLEPTPLRYWGTNIHWKISGSVFKGFVIVFKEFFVICFVLNKIISSVFWRERSASDWQINFHLFLYKDLGDLIELVILILMAIDYLKSWKQYNQLLVLNFKR